MLKDGMSVASAANTSIRFLMLTSRKARRPFENASSKSVNEPSQHRLGVVKQRWILRVWRESDKSGYP